MMQQNSNPNFSVEINGGVFIYQWNHGGNGDTAATATKSTQLKRGDFVRAIGNWGRVEGETAIHFTIKRLETKK